VGQRPGRIPRGRTTPQGKHLEEVRGGGQDGAQSRSPANTDGTHTDAGSAHTHKPHKPVQVAAVAPAAPNRPALHCPLHAAVLSPVVDPKVPAGHWVHVAALPRLKVPMAQGVQEEAPADENCPAAQGELVGLVDPARQK
jgi:hypothetical protein